MPILLRSVVYSQAADLGSGESPPRGGTAIRFSHQLLIKDNIFELLNDLPAKIVDEFSF
jgi:hypothetical protein